MSKKEPKLKADPAVTREAARSVERPGKGDGEDKEGMKPAAPETGEEKGGKEGPGSPEANERLLRLAADFDNFRKRVQKEKSELLLYGYENLIREILPVLDNFERAAEHVEKSNDAEAVRKGVELILSQLRSVLERFGVRCESALGKTFDPLVHEAVNHIPSKEHAANAVIDEHQKAYFLHERLIRPALVTVSKGTEEARTPAPAGSEDATVAKSADLKQNGADGTDETGSHGKDDRN